MSLLKPLLASVVRHLLRGFSGAAASLDRARKEGAELARQERYDEAIVVLRKVLEQEPGHAGTANLLGYCCTLARRYDEAMVFYDAALHADPALADALANAGWTAVLRGRGDANPYFRKWLALDAAGRRALAAAAPPERLALPEVTLCCVDCAYPELAAHALRATLARCTFGRALFLGDRDCGVEGVEFVPIERLASLPAYSNFVIHRLHEHVASSHALVIQYDGFVLSPAAWDPGFLAYDYIGPAVRFGDGRAGGIGGFSLRSRRLLTALRDDPQVRQYDAARAPYAEDIAICCTFRERLESAHGVRFAPGDVADRFAAEAIAPSTGSFGFHNLMHLVCLSQNGFQLPAAGGDGIRIRLRADSALGEISAQRELELRARGDLWANFIPAA